MQARQAVVLCCCCCFFLLLLWSGEHVFAVKGANLCPVWKYSKEAFQCPQWCAREDARYCCHTCHLPFCCLRTEAHLDWHRGRRALPKEAGAIPAPPTTSSVTDANTDRWTTFLPLIAILLTIITFGLLFSCCKKRYQRWRRALRMANVYRNWTAAPYPPLQHHQYIFLGSSPPPYTEDPPQYSGEVPQRNITLPTPSPAVAFHCARAEEDQEDEVTLHHLVHHQDVPGLSSEAPLGRETLV